MKPSKLLLAIFLWTVCMMVLTPANGQGRYRVLGKMIKSGVKMMTTEAIRTATGTIVENEINRRFYSEPSSTGNSYQGQARFTQITVQNDIPHAITHFWVSNDGMYWYPYSLYPGYYFTVNSNASGVVAVYNGYQVFYLDRSGQYYASAFFR